MAREDVVAVIKRAFTDDTFRIGLHRDFDRTLGNLSLAITQDEADELKKLDWQNLLGLTAGGGGSWVHIYSG